MEPPKISHWTFNVRKLFCPFSFHEYPLTLVYSMLFFFHCLESKVQNLQRKKSKIVSSCVETQRPAINALQEFFFLESSTVSKGKINTTLFICCYPLEVSCELLLEQVTLVGCVFRFVWLLWCLSVAGNFLTPARVQTVLFIRTEHVSYF